MAGDRLRHPHIPHPSHRRRRAHAQENVEGYGTRAVTGTQHAGGRTAEPSAGLQHIGHAVKAHIAAESQLETMGVDEVAHAADSECQNGASQRPRFRGIDNCICEEQRDLGLMGLEPPVHGVHAAVPRSFGKEAGVVSLILMVDAVAGRDSGEVHLAASEPGPGECGSDETAGLQLLRLLEKAGGPLEFPLVIWPEPYAARH